MAQKYSLTVYFISIIILKEFFPMESPSFDFSSLRELRKRSGLTIEEVSTRSGVSAAVISKLERNQSSAELETLYRLARVFGMTAGDLLSLAEAPFAQRAEESSHSVGGFSFREVNYSSVRVLHCTASAGDSISRPEIHQDDNELCWVLKGSLMLRLPREEITLTQGESLQFDAILEHTYAALTDCECIILHLRKNNRY